ncbi:MAG: crotonase/enoyl-CoA hydratase family protein [Pseudomonadota bacterium]
MSVTIELVGEIAVIELDDGGKNVINHELLELMEAAWDKAEAEAKAIVLKGRDGCFCAGFDLKVLNSGDAEAFNALGARGGRMARRIYDCSVPVVGVTEGHAMTIGLVWLAGCDLRIAEEGRFKFGMTEVALGVALPGWAVEPLRTRLQPGYLEPALLHSATYDPNGALAAGFIDRVAPTGEALDAAMSAAAELSKLAGPAYRRTKRALRQPVLAQLAEHFG